ncbi:hypothetical protein BC936DRAFT_145152 [Jimgerdemannia flammicorona]|uniref:Uncharacterized protein n=1 Tax=Jimgerdemannia flammicorona TaxID=994334 RepID=A0A433DAS9_9FUNG|nr:hypothetical protein BC936DRAFT_145152 [Jimgerdemannia flammicorona]
MLVGNDVGGVFFPGSWDQLVIGHAPRACYSHNFCIDYEAPQENIAPRVVSGKAPQCSPIGGDGGNSCAD